MTLKTLATALTIAVLPGLAAAMCSGKTAVEQQAMNCADGTMWDQASSTCVPLSTS
ncbi:MAG: hypothetical protein JJT81_15325 [Rubellimicrobium sp.]|nr:hypothetical protein [Rubellimicrobium sp.]